MDGVSRSASAMYRCVGGAAGTRGKSCCFSRQSIRWAWAQYATNLGLSWATWDTHTNSHAQDTNSSGNAGRRWGWRWSVFSCDFLRVFLRFVDLFLCDCLRQIQQRERCKRDRRQDACLKQPVPEPRHGQVPTNPMLLSLLLLLLFSLH